MNILFTFAMMMLFSHAVFAAPLTPGNVVKAKTGTVLMDSSIYEMSSGNVGIGSTNPRGALDVNGYIYGNGSQLTGITGGSSQWTGTSPIYYEGNVGISSTNPTQRLDVVGTGKFSTAVNTPAISNLTSNGIVRTSGSNGTLSVDTTVYETAISAGTTGQYWRGDKSWQTLSSTAVGLGNVANTAQVTSVTGTSPIVSSGGTTPAISIGTSGVSAGSFTNTNLTVDTYGRITTASNGTSGSGQSIYDLVVDGTTYPQTCAGINTAIGGASANDTIFLTGGSYTCGATITLNKAGLKLECASPVSTVITAGTNLNTNMIAITAADVTVKNCGINGNKTNQSTIADEYSVNGINIYNVDRAKIVGNTVTDVANHAIRLNNADYVTIADNRIMTPGKNGLSGTIYGNGVNINTSQKTLIVDNTIYGSLGSGVFFYLGGSDAGCGGPIDKSEGAVIRGNYISGVITAQQSGIEMNNACPPNRVAGKTLIADNFLYDMGVGAPQGVNAILISGDDNVIIGNSMIGITGVGVETSGISNVVSGNLIKGTGTGTDAQGMYLAGGGIVTDNIIYPVRNGMEISVNNLRISGYMIVNPLIGPDGILIDGGTQSNIHITGNTFIDQQTTPTMNAGVESASSVALTGFAMSGNTFVGTITAPFVASTVPTYANNETIGNFTIQTTRGNVGIGTQSPRARLEIDGTIYSNNFATGYASCWTTTGFKGHCTSAVGAGGTCTCVIN